MLGFFFFKQKTAYEMRISDWSSDVCSSDLGEISGRGPSGSIELTASFGDVSGLVAGDDVRLGGLPVGKVKRVEVVDGGAVVDFTVDDDVEEIGRASCRERVCQYV